MGINNGKCDRCGKPVRALRMSMFCTEMCCEACLHKESLHPLYLKAQNADRVAIMHGDYNFRGIGKPDDL